MKIFNNRNQKGFALIDVMIAALVLAVGSTAYMKLQNIGMQRSVQTKMRYQATMTANSIIEILRSGEGDRKSSVTTFTNELLNTKGSVFEIPRNAKSLKTGCNSTVIIPNRCDIKKFYTGGRRSGGMITDIIATNANAIIGLPNHTTASGGGPATPAVVDVMIEKSMRNVIATCAIRDANNNVRITVIWQIENGTNSRRGQFTSLSSRRNNRCPNDFVTSLTNNPANPYDPKSPDIGFVDFITKI